MTQRLRVKLLEEQPDVSRQLFLVASKVGIGHVGRIGESFNDKPYSIYKVYEREIKAAGMRQDTFTLSRVRSTQGVLVWLKTEALVSMAEAMGNTVKTILNNYIPDWLYHRMLSNTARRLQQKLIVLATAGECWQLPASDFTTVKQLEDFVVKTLLSDRRSDQLSQLFYKVFSNKADSSTAELYESLGSEFHICISPESIAALEVYVKHMSKAPFVLDQSEQAKGLDLTRMTSLYQLIYAAVHADPSVDSETYVLDLVSGSSQAQLKTAWKKSRALIEQFKALTLAIH